MNPKLIFTAVAFVILQGRSARAADEAIVHLPQVVVTEKLRRPAEHWRYAKQGSFEIISQTKDATVDKLVQTLELVPVIVKTIWPAPNVISQKPTEIILCDSERMFETFAPEEVRRAVNLTLVDRLFLQGESSEVIVLKCDKIDDADRFKDILRDYSRRCLLALKQPPPDWFVTGMAEVISDADYSVSGDKVKIQYAKLDKVTIRGAGMAAGPSLYDTQKPNQAVREIIRGAFDNHTAYDMISDDVTPTENLSHERFNAYFAKNHYHPGLADVLRHSAVLNPDDYRMTCWAFIHLCAFAQKRGYTRPLRSLLQLAGQDPKGDMIAMFRRAFGQSPRSLETTVSEYSTAAMSHGVTKEVDYPAPPPVVITDATPSQIAQLKSEAYTLSGHPAEASAEIERASRLSAGAPGIIR